MLLNTCHGHYANVVHKVLQTRVTNKKAKGGCVQDRYCGDIHTDIGLQWIGPKLGMPLAVEPRLNITPDNATPQLRNCNAPWFAIDI